MSSPNITTDITLSMTLYARVTPTTNPRALSTTLQHLETTTTLNVRRFVNNTSLWGRMVSVLDQQRKVTLLSLCRLASLDRDWETLIEIVTGKRTYGH